MNLYRIIPLQNIEKLRREVSKWLVRNELSLDTHFYTPGEWAARKEPYLVKAELVLVFEGALYRMINTCTADSVRVYAELERLARRFGYYFEQGHAWNMGFYRLPPQHLEAGSRAFSEQR
jgi:hypothetical protein